MVGEVGRISELNGRALQEIREIRTTAPGIARLRPQTWKEQS